eukprot:s2948_g9.t1
MGILVAQPPAKAQWARCLLRRDESKQDFHAEFKTDYDQDEEVQQRRRIIFDDMIQAVKQLQGGVSFDRPTKRWWLKGGAGAAKDFIARLRSLDFTFSEAEVEAFLHHTPVISTRPCPSEAFNAFDAFADEEAELDKLLSSGLLDEIEEREACREIIRPSQAPELLHPPFANCTALVNETVTAVRPGLAVKIGGLTSHPELNGCVGIVDQRDNQGSQSSQVRWLVTVHCHQYSLAEDKLEVEPNPVGPVQVPGTAGTAGTATANLNRLTESNANEAHQAALGETLSQGDRPQSDPPPQSTSQEAVVIDLETVPDEPRRESPAQEPRLTRACAICLEEKESTELTVFVPCGHMAACLTCGQRLSKQPCPVCRKKIKRVQQIFLAV